LRIFKRIEHTQAEPIAASLQASGVPHTKERSVDCLVAILRNGRPCGGVVTGTHVQRVARKVVDPR
jgi:hypothetical protein